MCDLSGRCFDAVIFHYPLYLLKSVIRIEDMHEMDELRKIDLNLLLTLHALLTEKHVTRAALRLHRSQPAVSHSLALLRIHFDDPLLIAGKGKMTLSARAQTLLAPLETALYELNNLLSPAAFTPATAQGRFRIAMSDYAARIVLPPLVAYLREQAPGLDLVITQASRERMLAQVNDGEVDLALGVFPDAPDTLQREVLFSEAFICLADKRFLPAKGELTLKEWLARPHIKLAAEPDAVDEIERALLARGLKRRICVSLVHWGAAINLLPGTDLVLTVASHTVSPDSGDETLARFTPPFPLPGFDFEQAWHARKNHDPAHLWLRDVIKTSCAPLR